MAAKEIVYTNGRYYYIVSTHNTRGMAEKKNRRLDAKGIIRKVSAKRYGVLQKLSSSIVKKLGGRKVRVI